MDSLSDVTETCGWLTSDIVREDFIADAQNILESTRSPEKRNDHRKDIEWDNAYPIDRVLRMKTKEMDWVWAIFDSIHLLFDDDQIF